MDNKKKFISVIWWYHKQIFSFHQEQNYHMIPFQVMMDEWYECELFAINSQVNIQEDPNFVDGITIIYYKNIFSYIYYLLKNQKHIIYSNTITLKTLLVWMIWKKTVFYPHSYPFGASKLKWKVIRFFYKYFSKIRVNNTDEFHEIEIIKRWLAFRCPLSISDTFSLNIDNSVRQNMTWIWNITDIKNPKILLETMSILKNKNIHVVLQIVWEDRYDEWWKNFQKLIFDYNLNEYINLLWVKSHWEIKEILSNSLLYINTSKSEWQCLAVYEAALAGNILCLQNIMAFPSVFWDNALYHNSPFDLAENIISILDNPLCFNSMIHNNMDMILKNYWYEENKKMLKELFINS